MWYDTPLRPWLPVCLHGYINILTKYHIRISITERYNPTDNAVAERMNGTLKTEWIYQQEMYKDYETALFDIGGMIEFYDNRWPNMSIGQDTAGSVLW